MRVCVLALSRTHGGLPHPPCARPYNPFGNNNWLSVCRSARRSNRVLACMYASLLACLQVCPSVCICLWASLSGSLSTYLCQSVMYVRVRGLPACLSAGLPSSRSAVCLNVRQALRQSVCLSSCGSPCLSLWPSACLAICPHYITRWGLALSHIYPSHPPPCPFPISRPLPPPPRPINSVPYPCYPFISSPWKSTH